MATYMVRVPVKYMYDTLVVDAETEEDALTKALTGNGTYLRCKTRIKGGPAEPIARDIDEERSNVFAEDRNQLSVETAKVVLDLVNDMSFDPKPFLEEMHRGHRTLQQNFTQLCLKWLYSIAELKENEYDLRNEASVTRARKVKGVLGEYGDSLPHV